MAACSVKQDSGDKGTSTSVDKTSDGSARTQAKQVNLKLQTNLWKLALL